MNASDTLDFALGKLEGTAGDEVRSDLDLVHRAERIRGSVLSMLGSRDGDELEPPPGLAFRTRSFVTTEIARLERPALLEFAPARHRFRFGDLAVAATIFFASLLALTPAVLRSKGRWEMAGCVQKLQRLGLRFHEYAAVHNSFPTASDADPQAHVGAVVSLMKDKGFPIEPKDLTCPCSGSNCGNRTSLPDLATYRAMLKSSPTSAEALLASDYAFPVGFGPAQQSVRTSRNRGIDTLPILADRPPTDSFGRVLDGNSPNHGGRGQNVFFADGHTAWRSNRWISRHDPDLYLNNDHSPSFGLHSEDSVLMPASMRIPLRTPRNR